MPYSAPGPFLGAQTASAYQISRSLRFRSSASAYLSRTPASAGNQQKFTLSCWVKRGQLGGSTVVVMSAYDGSSTTQGGVVFSSSDNLLFYTGGSGSYGLITTTAVYRDPSAWYHIVAVCDTTQATGTNRMALYVNGVAQSVTFNNTPAQNFNCQWNSTVNHTIGKYATGSSNIDGYLAEVNFIDGQALTPSSFGQSNALTGVWEPKQYTGTYGANGFYLPYSDPSGSGNGNDTYTKLLLHGNGLNDSAWNGSSNHALTAFGSATTSTTQTKFGMSSSLYTLGSSSQYFRTDASADFKYAAASGSTNDFTFDFWFYPGASGTASPVIGIADTTYSSLLIYSTQLYASSNNTGWDVATGQTLGSPVTGQWNHYAIVRSGSTWYTFLNGVQQATWTNSSAGYDYTTNNFIQFGRAQGGSLYSTGYYAEARWSAGIARWTSNFTPPTAPYSGGAGSDSSGNVNAWRPFNINTATSGTTYDSMIDSPTNYADGGNGRGNYAVWNSLSNAATYADANLSVTTTNNSAPYNAETTIKTPSSGKWYAEITLSAKGAGNPAIGIGNNNPDQFACYRVNGTYVTGSMGASSTGTPATFTTNDIIGVAFDADNGTLNFYKNGSLQTGGFTGITAGNYSFILREDSTSGDGAILNCGQRPFTYSNYGTDRPAATFLALNTQNLPTPTIAAGNKYFDATTYTGNGTSQSITNNGSFQPDLVWIKPRVAAGTSHVLTDAVRGVSKFLSSNGTSAESSVPGFQLTAFNSNGFTLVDNANGDYGVNGASGGTYSGTPPNFIAWNWNAGGAPTTDNVAGAGNVPTAGSVKINGANSTSALAGSIAATRLSANPSAGFSVVTWTGNGTTGTVGHGLGVAPSLIIMKRRDTGGTGSNWVVYSASAPLDFTTYPEWLYLNAANAFQTSASSANYPWSQRPSSTLFYMNTGTSEATNVNNATYVAYCFAPVAGYSAFGSYTGNGSADGPFIFCGFRPRWIMLKRTNSSTNWLMLDTTRNTYNVMGDRLLADTTAAETNDGPRIDILSNGFKLRESALGFNVSSSTQIYAAFAENPFKYSRAR